MVAAVTVGPNSDYATIAEALAAEPGETVFALEPGYTAEVVEITRSGLTFYGDATNTGFAFTLASGVTAIHWNVPAAAILDGSAGQDSIGGGAGDDSIWGAAGDDTLDGGLGSDSILGGGNDDRLISGQGNTTEQAFNGGGGTDTLVVNRTGQMAGISVAWSPGIFQLNDVDGTWSSSSTEKLEFTGGSGSDTVSGGDLGDLLDGGLGADSLSGGDGDDTLVSSDGNESEVAFDGGAGGIDTLVIDRTSATGVFFDFSAGDMYDAGGYWLALNFEVFKFTGGAASDIVLGGDLNDTLDGGLADDSLRGGDGDDIFISGTGNTIEVAFYGDAGTDTLVIDRTGATADLVISTSLGRIDVGDVTGSWSAYSVEQLVATGGSGQDIFLGGALGDVLDGGLGQDELYGEGGNDTLISGIGNTLETNFDGGADDDTLVIDRTGATDSVIVYIPSGLVFESNSGWSAQNFEHLEFTGGSGDDTALAGSGDSFLDGGLGADLLNGGAGNDTLISGSGNTYETSFDGLGGTDALVIDRTGAEFAIDLSFFAGPDHVVVTDVDTTWYADGFETISFAGGDGDDSVDLSGSGITGTFDGGAGVDLVTIDMSGNAADQSIAWTDPSVSQSFNGSTYVNFERLILKTGDGNDTIVTGAYGDVVDAGGGDDRVVSGAGNVVETASFVSIAFDGGTGTDTLVIDRTGATTAVYFTIDPSLGLPFEQDVSGAWLAANFEKLEFTGGDGNDIATGSILVDILNGGGGNDTLRGGGGGAADTFNGGAGNADFADIDASASIADETFSLAMPGTQQTLTTGANVINVEAVSITTGTGDDTITGGVLADYIDGGDGDDRLVSQAGNTYETEFKGGIGDDTLVIDRTGATDGVDVDLNGDVAESNTYWATSGFEHLEFTGGSGDDSVSIGASQSLIDGGAGTGDYASIDLSASTTDESLSLDVPAMQQALSNGTTLVNVEQISILTGEGDDTIIGGLLGDDVVAGEGDDVVTSQAGNETEVSFDGGDGVDTLVIDRTGATDDLDFAVLPNGDEVQYDVGGNWIATSFERLSFTGGDGDDSAYGSGGDDTLVGGGGDDFLSADAGVDQIDGGDGIDAVALNMIDATDGVILSLADSDTLQTLAGGTTVIRVEAMSIVTGIGDDSLTGGTFTDLIETGDGADTVASGGDADSIDGGEGNDSLDGGVGADFIDAGADNDIVISGAGNTRELIFDGGAGIDLLIFDRSTTAANVTVDILGSTINDVDGQWISTGFEQLDFTGGQGADQASGGGFADTLLGGDGRDQLAGRAGGDIVSGQEGADVLDGGAGNDFMQGGNGVDLLDGGADNDTLQGGSGIDTIDGGSGNDQLYGDSGNDAIDGGSGDDTIDGGVGVDTMDGGNSGNDTFIVDTAGDVVTEISGGGTDLVKAKVSYALLEGQEIEALTTDYAGSSAGISLTGNSFGQSLTGNAGANTLDGGGGADTMAGLAGNDSYKVDNAGDRVVEASGEGSDTVYTATSYTLAAGVSVEQLRTISADATTAMNLTGNELNNTLLGNAGSNLLTGGAGDDTMAGYGGNDTYRVDSSGDRVIEATGAGSDTVSATVSYALSAGESVERLQTSSASGTTAINLTGNELDNSLVGNAGINVLSGGAGADTMTGREGDDLYQVDNAGDVVIELDGGGSDTVATSTSYTLATGQSVEQLRTSSASATTAMNLTGNELNNTIIGNAGANLLTGGGGADMMTGLGGDDTYRVDNAGDVVIEASGGGSDAVSAATSYTLGAGQSVEQLRTSSASATTAMNLTGNELNNAIIGNAGNNLLTGGAGDDTMTGNGGDDTYRVDSAGDEVIEGSGGGTDTVSASTSYTLQAGQSIERLQTSSAGGTTAMDLTGNELSNGLVGNAGINILSGGAGQDSIDVRIDTAHDIVAFAAVSDSTSTTRDTIRNFDFTEDKFDFMVMPTAVAFVNAGGLDDGASFDTQLKAAVDLALAVDGAVLFNPNSGGLGLTNHSFLIVDANHDGVYTAGADYVVELVDTTGGSSALGINDFI